MISGVVADAKDLLISELTLTKLESSVEFAKAKPQPLWLRSVLALVSSAR